MNAPTILTVALGTSLLCMPVAAIDSEFDPGLIPNSSRRINLLGSTTAQALDRAPHRLVDNSMFAVSDAMPRIFRKHDLVQIIVQESSSAESTHELDASKDYTLDGKVTAWPDLQLKDLLQLSIMAGSGVGLPSAKLDMKKDFSGDGDFKREDDFTARLSAEVIAIRPNGNLVLEAKTFIKNDQEESTIKVTGECRPEDVDAINAVFSNRIHDLHIEKTTKGELTNATEKGLIAKFLDFMFAF